MSIKQIEEINYNRPECLYCKSICEAESGGEAAMVVTSYDCKSCGDYFSIISIAGSKELQFTCKEYCLLYQEGDSHFEIYNTDWASHEDKVPIPMFDIDFSNRERLYEKLKTYLIFA